MKLKLKVKYDSIEELEGVVVHIDPNSLSIWIAALATLKEGVAAELTLVDGERKFLLMRSSSDRPYSTYEEKGGMYVLGLSEHSLDYAYLFLLKLFGDGYAPVNHIHIDFSNPDLPEFTLTFLVMYEAGCYANTLNR